MSGVTMIVTQLDDGPLRRRLQELAALDASGYERARHEIGNYLVGQVQDNIDQQHLVDGAAMPQSAAAIKRSGKTLLAKGHLRDSYVYQLVDGGVEVGSAKIYAAIHHFGGATGRGHKTILPARPVLGIGPDTEDELGDIFINEIKRMMR